MPLFTTDPTDQAFERFMKHQPNYKLDAPEADRIQAELNTEKEKEKEKEKGRIPMIYRDDRHQNTFEKEASIRPDTATPNGHRASHPLQPTQSLPLADSSS